MTVNGIKIHYVDQGKGQPVVFVHGAFSDYRVWETQRVDIATRYRYVALTQRYFGNTPWTDDGGNYSIVTHTDDLTAFIRALNAGPVYLVGRSYGGTIALRTAAHSPELVKGVVAQEPVIAFSAVTEPDKKEILMRERKGLAGVKKAAESGDMEEATKLFSDWTNDLPGGFEQLPSTLRNMHLENGRTIPLHFNAPRPPKITCEQLGEIQVPVLITAGELTRPFFKTLADKAHECISGSSLEQIPGARHAATSQNPEAFNAVVLKFLSEH